MPSTTAIANASPTAGSTAPTVSPLATPDGGNIRFDSLFAAIACDASDEVFCPGGDPAAFDREAYRDVYVDPFGAGVSLGLYEHADRGSYRAFLVPQCGDSTVADPVRADGDLDPAGWRCPDGSPVIRCTDGTRPVAHLFPADDPDSTRWIVGISEGGAQCSGDDCAGTVAGNLQRFSSLLIGAGKRMPDRTFSAGLFQRAEFADFNRVMIDQCAGGRGLGRGQTLVRFTDPVTETPAEAPAYFHGSRIVLATLDRLIRREGAASPTQVVFVSQSNGSRGAYTELDGWAEWLNSHPAVSGPVDVRLYANSLVHTNVDIESCNVDPGCTDPLDSFDHRRGGWNDISGTVSAPDSTDLEAICPASGVARCHTNADGVRTADTAANGIAFNTLDYQPGGEEGDAAAVWEIEPDSSCLRAHPGEETACLDPMHVLLYHLSTPTFLALSGYDRYMRSAGEMTAATPTHEAWSLADYHGRLLAVARSLVRTKPGQKDEVRPPGHSVWIDNSADHEGATNVTKFDRTLARKEGAGAIALHESLRGWLDARSPHSSLCISDGKPHVNPSNPMNTKHGGTPLDPNVCF